MNKATRIVLLHAALDFLYDQPTETQNEWLEMGQGSAQDLLAEQLEKELKEEIKSMTGDYDNLDMIAGLALVALRKVDWLGIAGKLLRQNKPEPEEAGGADPAAA